MPNAPTSPPAARGRSREWTSRLRLLAALKGEEPDRVPIWMLFPRETYTSYADVYAEPAYRVVAPYVREHTDFFDRRGIHRPPFLTAAARVTSVSRDEGDERIVESTLETPSGPLTAVRKSWPSRRLSGDVKTYVEQIGDLAKILAIPYEPAEPDLSDFHSAAARLGDAGVMMVDWGMPFGFLHSLCTPEQLSLWTATEPAALGAFLEEMHRRSRDWLHRVLHKGGGPVFFTVGTEFVEPPLVNPAQFEYLCGRFDRELIAMMHEHDCLALVHHHGPADALLERIADTGADGIQPIEEPPVGDCPLSDAKRRIGDRVCIVGSVQYDDLARFEPDEIEALVRRQIRDTAAGGRYILAPTAGPYEPIISERMQDNYVRMIDVGRRWGKYPLAAGL